MVECGLGILAGSAPALKPLILRYCGSSELRENRLMSTNFILNMLKPVSRAYVHEESVVAVREQRKLGDAQERERIECTQFG